MSSSIYASPIVFLSHTHKTHSHFHRVFPHTHTITLSDTPKHKHFHRFGREVQAGSTALDEFIHIRFALVCLSLSLTLTHTHTFVGFGEKSKPEVPYGTALDVFIIICFALVFLALIEFAFINFLDLYVR